MNTHVTQWISAYYDGELSDSRREQVQAHLAVCPTCRAELQALANLTSLLHSVPVTAPVLPAENFAAMLIQQLPEKTGQPKEPQSRFQFFWLALPVMLISLWAFVQGVLLITLAGGSGWGQGMHLWSLELLPALPGWAGRSLLEFFRSAVPVFASDLLLVGWNRVVSLFITSVTAILLWGWVAGWWITVRASQLKVKSCA